MNVTRAQLIEAARIGQEADQIETTLKTAQANRDWNLDKLQGRCKHHILNGIGLIKTCAACGKEIEC